MMSVEVVGKGLYSKLAALLGMSSFAILLSQTTPIPRLRNGERDGSS